MKEFNAKVGLKGFDATESRPFGSWKNVLEEGKEVIFTDTGEVGKWGNKNWPMVKTDTGVECNSPYVASCMLDGKDIVVNGDNPDTKFHCMHTPRSAKSENIEFDYVQNNLREDGTFPKLKAVKTLPVAIKRADLIANGKKETLDVYQQVFGTPLEKLDVEYVPSYKKSKYDANKGVFSIKSTIVELA